MKKLSVQMLVACGSMIGLLTACTLPPGMVAILTGQKSFTDPASPSSPSLPVSSPEPVRSTSGYVSIQSHNYPDHFLRHRDFLGELTTLSSDLDRKDANFKIVPGLADGSYISFESLNYPGYFLRHQGFQLKLHARETNQLYIEDASFKKVPGLADSSWTSFESYNYPKHYIRHRDFHVYLEQGNDALFREDTTFKLTESR